MKINFDILSKLAGLPASGRRLNEAYEADGHSDDNVNEADYLQELEGQDETDDIDPSSFMEGEEEDDAKEGGEGHDEPVLEIDEVMLVQELRRAKKIMQESKRRSLQESRRGSLTSLQEAQLKKVIDEEVRNVMADLNLTSGWVYGDNKPKRSRHGYSHQGSYLKGLGFK